MYRLIPTLSFLFLLTTPVRAADPAAELDALRQQIQSFEQTGEYGRAEALLGRAEQLAEQLPADSAYRGTVWNDIAHLHHEACRARDAERWYRKALAQLERVGTEEGVETVLVNLAVLYLETGKLARARQTVQRLESVTSGEQLTPFRRMRLETVRGRLAALEGDFPAAEQAIGEAQRAAELAGNPGAMSSLYYDFGVLYLRRNDLTRSAEAFGKARSLIERTEGPNSPRMVGVLFNIAGIASRQGRHEEALADSTRAVEQSVQMFAPGSPAVAVAWQVHGDILRKAGRKKESKAALREAESILARNGGGPVVDRTTVDIMMLRQGR